ncbi:MAG: hypothetical protein H6677_15960 [Candidatus Obscuribacterales bacterium]|nr:hypothetical protein [Candidatus Obscuribacterales bacterium]
MYKPKPKKQDDNPNNRLKLPTEVGCPSMAKVKFMLEEATNRRGCLVELPWTAGNASFISTCQWESTVEEPVWTLYQDESGGQKVVWTQSFAPSDLEFMYDILVMSAPKGTSSTKIPELLMPEDENPKGGQVDTTPDPQPISSGSSGNSGTSGSFPEVAPLPQPQLGGLGGGMGPMPGASQAISHPPQGAPPQQAPMPPQQAPPPQQPPYGGYPGYPPQQQPPYGGYPGYPPPQQPPYGGYPGYPPQPGYPPPQQMPYDPYAGASSPPGTMGTSTASGSFVPVDYHLLDKRSNVLIGSLLKDAELISNVTLEAALKLQEMVREEKLSAEKAPSVLKRLHQMGADIDQHLTPEDLIRKPKKRPPEAGQAKPRPPAPSASAPQGAQGAQGQQGEKPKRNLKPAFDLLEKAGILSADDVKDALAVRKKHGGDLVGILEAANKLNRKTVDAAFICLPLIREGLMKSEQCIIALNYCSRMRVGFDEALDEMGWQNPRKIRTDLPLN